MDNVNVLLKIYAKDYSPVEKAISRLAKKHGCTWRKSSVISQYYIGGERCNVLLVCRTLREMDILRWTDWAFVKTTA